MNYRILSLVALVLAVAAAPSLAGPGDKADTRKGDPERRAKMLEKFDADGDGKLSEEERATAQAERKKRAGDAGTAGRGRGKGRGKGRSEGRSEGRRGGPMQAMFANPDQMFQTLDANGDGQLSRSEFQAMIENVQKARDEMRSRMGQGGGQRGQRGQRGPGRRAEARPERPARPPADDSQSS